MRRITLAVSVALLSAALTQAQPARQLDGPAAARNYEKEKVRLLRIAELMPAEHYGFRQASGDKPFSAQLIAVATLGTGRCGELLGRKVDLGVADPQATIVAKADVAAALAKGFATCDPYFETLAAGAKPASNVPDILDHMASMAVYLSTSLRAKGIEPPRVDAAKGFTPQV